MIQVARHHGVGPIMRRHLFRLDAVAALMLHMSEVRARLAVRPSESPRVILASPEVAPKVSSTLPNSYCGRRHSSPFRSKLADSGHMFVDVCHTWLTSGRIWPTFAQHCPDLGECGRCWTHVGQLSPTSGELWPDLAAFGGMSSFFIQMCPTPVGLWPPSTRLGGNWADSRSNCLAIVGRFLGDRWAIVGQLWGTF